LEQDIPELRVVELAQLSFPGWAKIFAENKTANNNNGTGTLVAQFVLGFISIGLSTKTRSTNQK
jgi:hypothetical protein